MSTTTTLRTVPALVLGLLLLLLAAPAHAHTELEAAAPGPGDVLRSAPADLSLSFVSMLVPEGTQVIVRDPEGVDHVRATSTAGQLVRVQLTPFDTAGTYVVDYRAVAGDGHPITGSYEVEVTAAAAAAATLAGAPPTAPVGDDLEAAVPATGSVTTTVAPTALTWTIGALGAGCLALLLAAGSRRRPDAAAVAVRS